MHTKMVKKKKRLIPIGKEDLAILREREIILIKRQLTKHGIP